MKKKETLHVIEKLGFEIRTKRENFALYRHGGKLILTTAVPKGRGDLHVKNQFRQQLKLTETQLNEAVRCPFGRKEYLEHLIALGHVTKD